MPAMTTTLKEYASNGDSRTFSYPGHTVAKPRLLTQTRVPAANPSASADNRLRWSYGTTDTAGTILQARNSSEIFIRSPLNGTQADLDELVADIREVVNSDEFTAMIATQNFISEN